MTGVVELVDRAVALPPGPELSAVLEALPRAQVPNARLVEVAQARSRQLAHEQAELFADLVEIAHAVAVADLPGANPGDKPGNDTAGDTAGNDNPADKAGNDTAGNDKARVVGRAGERFEWAAHEIAAGLTWTPTGADRELGFATALCERLPLVFAALRQGHIDRGKSRVFVEYLDPANGELTEQQARRLCEKFVPQAPKWTTKQLSDRLYRALHAIDPALRRRRYERAVQERGVALYLDPRTGTATLVGTGLPPDEAAAAGERIDRLVEATKRAGHPGRRPQISADAYLGMLNGGFHGLTEQEIIDRLLATRRPEDNPDDNTPSGDTYDTPDTDTVDSPTADDDTPDDDTVDSDTADNDTAGDGTADNDTVDSNTGDPKTADAETAYPDSSAADTTAADSSAAEAVDGAEVANGAQRGADDTDDAERGAAETADQSAGEAAGRGGNDTGRWAGDPVATREGIEIRVGLATLAGLDERPGEIPGLGPIGAHLARDAVRAQLRGGSWKFAIVDTDGYLLLAGPLRRRPRGSTPSPPAPVRGGVVELHLTLDELRRYGTDPALGDPALGDWQGVLAEIAAAWADRDEFRRRLAANPHARFARGPLADHVRIRDRHCCGPGCTRSARRSDLDHTRDHARGGLTVEVNIDPACKRHHPDKNRGWALAQPQPGLFLWVSPLGRIYLTKGEPIRPDLPDPNPAPHQNEETATEADQRLRRHDPRILERPAEDRLVRPPPPKPEPPPADEPPPF